MQIIPYAQLVAMPWKNGGGETRQLAAFPPGSDFETFVWRLSIADISEDGDFSSFPNIDRTLILLSGAGVELRLDDENTAILRPGDSIDFAGEQKVFSRLLDGPVQDLNLMLRRGRIGAVTQMLTLDGQALLDLGAAGGAIVLRQGDATLPDGSNLAALDTILHTGEITLQGRADLIVIRFRETCA